MLEDLNEQLEEQKKILTGIITPFEEYTELLTKAPIPSDPFGEYFQELRDKLEKGFAEMPKEEFISFTEDILNGIKDNGFSPEANKALKTIIKNGYLEVFKILGGDVDLRASVSGAFADLFNDPYNFELEEAYNATILDAFKKLTNIQGELTDEQQRGYEAFEKNLKSLIQ